MHGEYISRSNNDIYTRDHALQNLETKVIHIWTTYLKHCKFQQDDNICAPVIVSKVSKGKIEPRGILPVSFFHLITGRRVVILQRAGPVAIFKIIYRRRLRNYLMRPCFLCVTYGLMHSGFVSATE